jgi:hypothetical protein
MHVRQEGLESNKARRGSLITLCLCLLCLVIGVLMSKVLGETAWSKDNLPGPMSSGAMAFASPVVNVHVEVKVVEPTLTVTPQPTPFDYHMSNTASTSAFPTPTAVTCDPNSFIDGFTCRMPDPTPKPNPTLPTCFSAESRSGTYCMMRGTPAPMAASPEE